MASKFTGRVTPGVFMWMRMKMNIFLIRIHLQ
jgi:hypothetical protein